MSQHQVSAEVSGAQQGMPCVHYGLVLGDSFQALWTFKTGFGSVSDRLFVQYHFSKPVRI